jgi:HSP20 family protein
MSKLTVWNPWGIAPRDFWDANEDFFGTDEVQMDMYETKDSIVIDLKAAGFGKDNVTIEVESNRLTIRGNAKNVMEEENKDKKYYRKEIKTMSFTRNIDLPATVVADKSKAVFKNGVLNITLPKSEEAKPKKISVEVSE